MALIEQAIQANRTATELINPPSERTKAHYYGWGKNLAHHKELQQKLSGKIAEETAKRKPESKDEDGGKKGGRRGGGAKRK
jgi:hypothetical protein